MISLPPTIDFVGSGGDDIRILPLKMMVREVMAMDVKQVMMMVGDDDDDDGGYDNDDDYDDDARYW